MAQGASSPGAPAILSEGRAPKFDIARSKSARRLAELWLDSLSVSSRALDRIFCATCQAWCPPSGGPSDVVSGFHGAPKRAARRRQPDLYPFANTGIDNTTALFDPNPAFSDGGDHSCPP